MPEPLVWTDLPPDLRQKLDRIEAKLDQLLSAQGEETPEPATVVPGSFRERQRQMLAQRARLDELAKRRGGRRKN